MNRLNGLGAYLSGPIDFDADSGHGWRDAITEFLVPKNIRVFNPLKHTFHGTASIDEVKRPKMKKLKDKGEFKLLRKELKDINHWDLRGVDLSSFLIVNYDIRIPMCGTHEEIFIANKQMKPVLLMVGPNKKKLSNWLFGRFPDDHMFSSWKDLKEYLTSIDSNKYHLFTKSDKKRWLFFEGEHMH